MEGNCDEMVSVMGANVTEIGGEVKIHGADASGHARRALVDGKGFDNDWFKTYFSQ